MVSAADNSQEMKNYRNSAAGFGLRPTPLQQQQHNNRGHNNKLAGAEIDVSLKRPINQLIRADNSTSVTTTNSLISIGSGGGSGSNEPEVKVKEYVVLIGNRKWIQEKNFIEIPPDVEAKLTQQEALVSV